jgi:hypothetical protein
MKYRGLTVNPRQLGRQVPKSAKYAPPGRI